VPIRTAAERLELLDTIFTEAARQGLMLQTADDAVLDGRVIAFDGREVVNFGSCSYLGLEMDDRLKAGVIDAVQRYGTQFSSSRSYVSAPPYAELEATLSELFGGPTMVAASTSLGHLSTLPVVVGSGDAVILDQQVHHSVHLAVNQLRTQGIAVEVVRHNRMDLLEERIEALRHQHDRVWYMADGVYSMFADLAPVHELHAMVQRHEQLHLYIDDSHGMSWTGEHGRGYVLDSLPSRERTIVACSLNKAFAAAGGAFVFPDAEMVRKVRTCGGTMIFSGPVQPPMLGAALASARIHLSPDIDVLQQRLAANVALCNRLMEEAGLPLVAPSHAPIRYVGAGLPHVASAVVERLLSDGLYVNAAPFPAVPMKKGGIRTPLTVHHTEADIRRLVDALAVHLPAVLAENDSSIEEVRAEFGLPSPEVAAPLPAPAMVRGGLTLETARSIDEVDAEEWDRLLGDHGSFTADGLRFLEATFTGNDRPEDSWDFVYYVVRDAGGRPVLATFFTAALWKDDMLAPAAVSRKIEQQRASDPYYLTSRTFAMGSLLTEGSHIHLDRSADWRGALDLMLDAADAERERSGAATLILRDFDSRDVELVEALRARGLAMTPVLDSLVLEIDFDGDDELLRRLSYKSRTHLRREVLAWEDKYETEVLRKGGRVPSADELDHLHELYRAVEKRGFDLNSFGLPRHVFRRMLDHDCWELVLLRLRPEHGGPADGRPVAFGAHFVGRAHYAPLVVGLDYDFVRSHRSYRQGLHRAIRRGRELGAQRVLLGMGATLEKRRFGATVEPRCAFVRATDHYAMEVMASLEADTALAV
jgi:7-keto-8-aminopelargonate synthetase-like enzyme